MKRITTNNPKTNGEMLMNFAYAKNGIACLRYINGVEDVPLHEYVRSLCVENYKCDFIPDDIIEDGLMDCEDCPIAILYYLGCQAVENNARLMRYKDNDQTLTDY